MTQKHFLQDDTQEPDPKYPSPYGWVSVRSQVFQSVWANLSKFQFAQVCLRQILGILIWLADYVLCSVLLLNFFGFRYTWDIPISYTTSLAPNFDVTEKNVTWFYKSQKESE